MSLRFHWSLSQVGDEFRGAKSRVEANALLSFEEQTKFCHAAEASGIDSVLMALGSYRPDPMTLSMALGMMTKRIKFMVAVRPGVLSPTLFVQQVNTVSALTRGRITVNVVTGSTPQELHGYGSFLEHDERFVRADEFLDVCRALWRRGADSDAIDFDGKYYSIKGGRLNLPFVSDERASPEIYVGGNSEPAKELAGKHAHCLWRYADTPERLRPHVRPLVERGVEVGLQVSMIARPTREQAMHDAYAMIEKLSTQSHRRGRELAHSTDSVAIRSTYELAEKSQSDWLTPHLWTGAIPHLGSISIALVGSPESIASAILEYKEVGISQFLFIGWPDLGEMTYFGRAILPRIRELEGRV